MSHVVFMENRMIKRNGKNQTKELKGFKEKQKIKEIHTFLFKLHCNKQYGRFGF